MPKIIFTSRYMRNTPPAQLQNYVRYISTREGVEKIDESKLLLPAAINQQKLIRQLIRDIPASKEMLEYADFLLQPTIGNASEFISCALEQHLDLASKRENYVDYIANRPRVERVGEHGLFTDAGQPVVLAQVQNEVIHHKGPVWTHVVSLRREDAARLGYDSAEQWMALLRSKRAMLCKHMKIDSANLRWYAAFHNESHHPHVHLMVYSAKDNDGFLTEKSIEAMRSELAHDMFRQDFARIYEEQNQARAELKSGAADVLQELMDALRSGTLVSPDIERQMMQLAARLQNTSGKKVYGYLKRDVKNLIDQIVDELARDARVNALYQAWGKWNNEVLLTYQKEAPPLPPLSAQPQFKSIKNRVITEAMKLGGHHFTFEDEQMELPMEPDTQLEPTEPSAPEDADAVIPEWTSTARTSRGGGRSSMWSDRYQEARSYLFGDKDTAPDFTKAYDLFLQEAESGNPLAMHDLGRMFADGLGTEQDYTQAASWISKAVAANHKYAQYSLAGLYYRGQGVVQSYERAFHLYSCSAKQGNPYASYELAKMYRDGIGTKKGTAAADKQFKDAFAGFYHLEQDSHDDKLQYRLGQMLHTGTGTEQDDMAAADYWERSAKLGNPNAQYALGKLWLENGTGDPAQAVAWIAKAAEGGNAAAQYSLAKLHRDGGAVERDIGRAVELFMLSAEQKNEYAAFALGKLYLAGEDIPRDVDAAIKWLSVSADLGNSFAQYTLAKLYLTGEDVAKNISEALKRLKQSAEQENEFAEYQLGRIYLVGEDVPKDVEAAILWLSRSADQGNQFAQYAIGKLYLCGHDVPRDKEKAIPFLQASAAQGNIYAQFLLDHLDAFRDSSVFLAATRLFHRLENLFREDYRKVAGGTAYHIDRKRRRKVAEKKQAQGHKRDDQEPIRQQTY